VKNVGRLELDAGDQSFVSETSQNSPKGRMRASPRILANGTGSKCGLHTEEEKVAHKRCQVTYPKPPVPSQVQMVLEQID
jgi:hypothetical protein